MGTIKPRTAHKTAVATFTIPNPFPEGSSYVTLRVELEICEHKNTIEVYENESSFPNYYKCVDCESKFPTLGDTDLWASGVKIKTADIVK